MFSAETVFDLGCTTAEQNGDSITNDVISDFVEQEESEKLDQSQDAENPEEEQINAEAETGNAETGIGEPEPGNEEPETANEVVEPENEVEPVAEEIKLLKMSDEADSAVVISSKINFQE